MFRSQTAKESGAQKPALHGRASVGPISGDARQRDFHVAKLDLGILSMQLLGQCDPLQHHGLNHGSITDRVQTVGAGDLTT